MRLLIFFFKYWTVSYLQFGYFFLKYAYCTWIELQTRVILDTLHRGEPPFEGKKKNHCYDIYHQKRMTCHFRLYAVYMSNWCNYQINIFTERLLHISDQLDGILLVIHWSNHDYKWNRIRIMILHLSLRKYSPIFVLVKLMIDVKKYSLHSRFTFSLEQIRSSPKWDLAYKPFL